LTKSSREKGANQIPSDSFLITEISVYALTLLTKFVTISNPHRAAVITIATETVPQIDKNKFVNSCLNS
jgi:hypothetical protein